LITKLQKILNGSDLAVR